MSKRTAMALVAMVGLFLSLYLTLYKLGVIGTLTCGTGSCETVQLSRWGTFLGLPVAAWGVGFYATVLALALVGVQERFAASRAIAIALLAVTGWGVLFSAWLTWLEALVINAWCRWCLVSAGLTVILGALALADWWELRASRTEISAPDLGGHG